MYLSSEKAQDPARKHFEKTNIHLHVKVHDLTSSFVDSCHKSPVKQKTKNGYHFILNHADFLGEKMIKD